MGAPALRSLHSGSYGATFLTNRPMHSCGRYPAASHAAWATRSSPRTRAEMRRAPLRRAVSSPARISGRAIPWRRWSGWTQSRYMFARQPSQATISAPTRRSGLGDQQRVWVEDKERAEGFGVVGGSGCDRRPSPQLEHLAELLGPECADARSTPRVRPSQIHPRLPSSPRRPRA